MCATPGVCVNETELFSSAAVVPQSKWSTEFCSLAAVVRQSTSTELCSWAAVVPQSKSTELRSSPAVVPHKVNLLSCVVARRPLCHKVNLPRCEARRRHFIMTCDIFGTGQTNILQGHPATVFYKLSVRRSKYWLKFSVSWGRLKIARWLFHSCTIVQFGIKNYRWIQTLTAHLYRVSLGVK